MTGIPIWLGATAGQATQAGQISQFLGAHAATYLYAGTLHAQANTAGSGSSGSNGQWLAQSFTTASGQTQVGRVVLTLALAGSPAPTTIGIYASSGGLPTGSALASTPLPKEFVPGTATAISIPVPCTVTALTQYWIIMSAAGSSGNQYSWSLNNVGSGAAISTNGTTYTSQAFGLMYQMFDQTVTGNLTHIWEDAGARWTYAGYNSSNQITKLEEYTVGQASGYIEANRTLTYSGSSLIGVA